MGSAVERSPGSAWDGDPERDTQPRGRGRPRTSSIDRAVLEATTQLLQEVGARGTTIAAIAARSGCSKASIYRRWPSRDSIVLDALRVATKGTPADIELVIGLERRLGSAVHAAAHRGATAFSSPMLRAVLPVIARELLAGSSLGDRFRAEIFQPIRRDAAQRLERAIERGEVAGHVDGDLLFDLVYGTMLYRALVGEPLDETVAQQVGDLVMHGAAGAAYRDGNGSD